MLVVRISAKLMSPLMEKDREKPFLPPEPPVESGPRDDVRAATSPVRCPFCHSDVSPDARDWVACRACLARHHAGCWNESKACASCRATEPLVASGPLRAANIATIVALLAAMLLLVLLWGVVTIPT